MILLQRVRSSRRVNCRFASVFSGVSEDLLVSSSIGHQVGGSSHAALVGSLIRTNVVVAGSRLEAVLRRVDRGDFVSSECRVPSERYANKPLKIGTVATISTPQHHAQVLRLLEPHLQPGMTALDVGCGSGILVAAMTRFVGPKGYVTGVDIVPDLVNFSKANLQRSLGKKLAEKQTKIILSAGKKDLRLPTDSCYDCVHVGVAVETKEEAESFLKYVKIGGALLIPLGKAGSEQKLVMMTKCFDGTVVKRDIMNVLCQPILDSVPIAINPENRANKLARIEVALTQWRKDFEARTGQRPTRNDLMDNADSKTLFEEFAALRKLTVNKHVEDCGCGCQ